MSDLVEKLRKEGGLYEDEARFAIATVLRDLRDWASKRGYRAVAEELENRLTQGEGT